MWHSTTYRLAARLAAVWALVVTASCATQPEAEQREAEARVEERADASTCEPDSEPRPFQPLQSYAGNLRLPADSLVVNDEQTYETFVGRLPEKKVTKRHPPPDSDDPLLRMPDIDFDRQMLVVAVCPTFYCTIEFVGIRDECGRRVIVVELPGEGENSEYYARPYGIGNYRAVLVPRVDAPFAFEYRGPGQRPGSVE